MQKDFEKWLEVILNQNMPVNQTMPINQSTTVASTPNSKNTLMESQKANLNMSGMSNSSTRTVRFITLFFLI